MESQISIVRASLWVDVLEQKEDGSYPVEDDYRIDYLAQHIKEIASFEEIMMFIQGTDITEEE